MARSGPPRGRSRPEPKPRWRIDDVLDRTDLASLLDYLARPATYAARGRRWHCPMPNHDDQRPSVTMRTDHRGHERWRCWSGDDTHRGDAIDLVMVTQHVDRAGAIEWLANRAGLAPDRPLPSARKPKPPPRPRYRPLDPAVVTYAETCERLLQVNAAAPVRRWLADRGLRPEVVRANRVGADLGRDVLMRYRGLPRGASMAATFPALDPNGNIRYVQARYLDPDANPHRDKYDNPASDLGTNPRLSWTVPVGSPRPGVLVVCEGIPDALVAAQNGFRSVAVLGSQSPDTSVAARISVQAQRHGLEVVAIADADDAGRRWADTLTSLLEAQDQPSTIIEPPTEGHDLNDWALTDPTWADTITEQTPDLLMRHIPPEAALSHYAIDVPEAGMSEDQL